MDIELWKARKKELKLTFDALAEQSGVSRRQLIYLFNGDAKNAGVETVQRIERALGLVESTKKSPPSDLTEGESEWMELYYALTEENRELLVQMVGAFKDLPAERRRFVLDAIRLAANSQK